jgi:uncharacterized protein YjbI with pentapeptide repeats
MLLTVIGTVLVGVLIDMLTGWHVYDRLFYPAQKTPADVQTWSALIYALALIGGLPVAFLVWHWRDVNKRAEIENTRKDINLKEFQEVQLRAAGALDEKLPQEAREQLQIAALHQLRGFLRGDYGESFKRPAFELLLAGHAAAVHRIGVPEAQENLESQSLEDIRKTVRNLHDRLTPIDRTRMLIMRDEYNYIFTPEYPLEGRRFDLLDLSHKILPDGLNFSTSHFFGAIIYKSHVNRSDFSFAHFEGGILRNAKMHDCKLSGAYLEGADLRWTVFKDADLFNSHLESADFRRIDLEYYADCEKATFNAETKFGDKPLLIWKDVPESEKEAARAPWIARGMINVDAPPA